MYHPKSASYKIATGQIENSNSVKDSPSPQKNKVFTSSEEKNSTLSISGPKNTTHKGVVLHGKALGPGAENTHFFDGKLLNNSFMSLIKEETAEDIQKNINRAGGISDDIKRETFKGLDGFIHSQKNFPVAPKATRCLRTIISCHDTYGRSTSGGNQNYSPPDKLHACDLLYLLYEKIVEEDNKEYLNLTLSQLEDMETGLCPMGRCNRLFQTYVMLRDDLTTTSKPVEN